VTEAARTLEGVLGEEAFVVTLQNGVEAPGQVASALGPARVVPGRCDLMSYVTAPGHIRHAAVEPRIHFGESDGRPSARVEALRQAFAGAVGVTAAVPDDIEAALWEKFLFIAPVSAVLAVSRSPIGAVREVGEARRLLQSAMEEVAALARARGVRLAGDAVARVMGYVDGLPYATTTSMQRDTLEGRPSELEYQAGTVVRLAGATAVPVPTTEFLYAALLPGERRARAGVPEASPGDR
jgi:2-dehydropantoate 2-reductase